jgi:quercetin dioxygenase-like cupin family protein
MTNSTDTLRPSAPGAVSPTPPVDDAHEAIWMLNSLMVERATSADTNGAYAILDQWITPDGNPPPHVHENEDEAFLVLEGSIDVTVGDSTKRVEAGGFAFGPRGVPHTYAVTSEWARLLVVVSPGGAERFFKEVGTPADATVLPDPQAPDATAVVGIAARHGITILPPPGA